MERVSRQTTTFHKWSSYELSKDEMPKRNYSPKIATDSSEKNNMIACQPQTLVFMLD
jgi:hypothetical protein